MMEKSRRFLIPERPMMSKSRRTKGVGRTIPSQPGPPFARTGPEGLHA